MPVAKGVAEEVSCQLAQEAGYMIHFKDYTSSVAHIKYVTDGTLQRECLIDPDVSLEAHEHAIATDVLIGLLESKFAHLPNSLDYCLCDP